MREMPGEHVWDPKTIVKNLTDDVTRENYRRAQEARRAEIEESQTVLGSLQENMEPYDPDKRLNEMIKGATEDRDNG